MDETTTKWFRLTITFNPPGERLSENGSEKARLPTLGDTVSSVRKSINKDEQTVLSSRCDSSVFISRSVCADTVSSFSNGQNNKE